MKHVAVLGMGIIGSVWARNLHADGLEVRAWNRTPKDLPYFQPDPMAAIAGAEMIFVVVADPAAVENILNLIVPHLKPGQIVAQSSTISAHWTKLFAERVEKTGAEFLEAPFTGSKPAAEARKTVFYLGGAGRLVEKANPVLERISASRLHVGEIGSASSLKLAMNLNLAVMMQGLCESLTLARQAGISDDKFFDALRMNAGRSPLSDLKEPKLKTGDFSPQFSLKHMSKDLRLARETAGAQDLPLAAALTRLYANGMSSMGEDDFAGVIRLLKT